MVRFFYLTPSPGASTGDAVTRSLVPGRLLELVLGEAPEGASSNIYR